MATLTIRIPDDTHARLRQLARNRKIGLNKVVEELATAPLAQGRSTVQGQRSWRFSCQRVSHSRQMREPEAEEARQRITQ